MRSPCWVSSGADIGSVEVRLRDISARPQPGSERLAKVSIRADPQEKHLVRDSVVPNVDPLVPAWIPR